MTPKPRADNSFASGRLIVTLNSVAAAVLVFALSWAHGPAPAFLYDAVQYWEGPLALLAGGDVVNTGVLSMRGVLTSIVYLAPAAATSLLGPASAVWTVLAWNSLLAAFVCVILLPRLAGLVAPGNLLARIWLSAAIGGVLFSGYARFPLLDIWAVAAALTGLYLLMNGRQWWTAILAGMLFVTAVNLRPAYLAPLGIALVVLLISRRRRVLWVVPGVVVALIPQFALNIAAFGSAGLVPPATSQLVRIQAAQAAYAIRYDTVAFTNRHPQQWYCDPAYAALVADDPTHTDQLGVVGSVFTHLPQSLWFLTQKVAASLQWSFLTPYERAPGSGTSLLTLLVIAVAAIGVVALATHAVLVRKDRTRLVASLALLGFWFGSLAILGLSTPETRFAIPLVVIGLIGMLTVVPSRMRDVRPTRAVLIGASASIVLAAGLLAAGNIALAHPAPEGPLPNASSCAELG